MNKKNLLLALLVLSFIIGIIITFTVDIHTSQYKDNLIDFHEKGSDVIYVDTYFNDELIPNITDKNYAEELKNKISEITKIIEKEVEPNLITSNARTKDINVLEAKASVAKEGIEKIIKLIEGIEKSMPENVKSSYKDDGVKKLRDFLGKLPSGSVTTKKLIRFLLIIALGVVGGVLFINIEKKARETGEIKAKDVA